MLLLWGNIAKWSVALRNATGNWIVVCLLAPNFVWLENSVSPHCVKLEKCLSILQHITECLNKLI